MDRAADRPPFRQIADQLRAAIAEGRLAPGDRLPSESELIAVFGVARMTARQAIADLGRLVRAEHGRGVFVAAAGCLVPGCDRDGAHPLEEHTVAELADTVRRLMDAG